MVSFSKDYEYVKDSGDLDECNGRFTITKEYPKGTYAYFLQLIGRSSRDISRQNP